METLMQICPLLYLHMSNDQSPCCVVYTWSNKTCCLKQDPKKLRIQKLIINPTSKVLGRNCVDQKRHIAALFTWLSLPRSVYLHGVVAIPCPQMSCFGVFTIIWTMRRFEMLVMGRPNHVGCENWAHLGKWEISFVDVTKTQHSRHTVLHFVITRYGRKYNIVCCWVFKYYPVISKIHIIHIFIFTEQ